MSRSRAARSLAAGALLAGFAAGCADTGGRQADAPSSPGQLAGEARGYLDGLVREHQFSGAVLVERDGRVLMQGGFGLADAARHLPDTATTRFRIGSLTKQFTAVAILQLQDEGRLRATDPACRFLSSCPAAWRRVTVAELLTNSSGIPDYVSLPGYSRLSRQHLTPAQIAALVASEPLLFRPGTRWSYSNTGYVLLGMIVTRVSGLSYAAFLTRHVFAPLRMRDTGYDVNNPPPGHATGYAGWQQPAPYIDMSVPYAAGALYSTTADLSRWDDALMGDGPRIVRPATLLEMFRPRIQVVPEDPGEGWYGYGWFIDENGTEYDHDGLINGFASVNAIFPAARAEIIVLSNLQTADVRTITERLAALIGLHAS